MIDLCDAPTTGRVGAQHVGQRQSTERQPADLQKAAPRHPIAKTPRARLAQNRQHRFKQLRILDVAKSKCGGQEAGIRPTHHIKFRGSVLLWLDPWATLRPSADVNATDRQTRSPEVKFATSHLLAISSTKIDN